MRARGNAWPMGSFGAAEYSPAADKACWIVSVTPFIGPDWVSSPADGKRALNRVSNGTTVDSASRKRCFT